MYKVLNAGVTLERVNKGELWFTEGCRILQLRVVTDVFVQNGDCQPLVQLSAGAGNIVSDHDDSTEDKDQERYRVTKDIPVA